MTKLQQLLDRFLAREIGLDELQQQFALLLAGDSDLPMSAAAWLDAGEQDGRLSATVCRTLKNALESHLAAAYVDPDSEFADVFDSPAADEAPATGDRIKTEVLEPGGTVMGTQSIGSEPEPQEEGATEIRSV